MNEVITNIGYEITKDKMESYSSWDNIKENFIGANETTVTITLHEYRRLITAEANAEKSKLQSENYKLNSEIGSLKKEVESLKTTLATLCGKKMDEVEE